jgi:putative ABC transport system ATP-binding protein
MGSNSLHVLKGIDFEVKEGELVAIMGSSGSGKSTLLNIIGMLDNYDTGSYELDNVVIKDMDETKAANYRNKFLGFIFQSFNLINYKTALENVILPLYYQGVERKNREAKALKYLDDVGLKNWATHMPNELSGGQKQRVGIARAISVGPKVLICDESVSALDVSVQAQVLNLLNHLKKKLKLTYIFISHDLSVVKYMADKIVVMKEGVFKEIGFSEDIYNNPKMEYTKRLIEAIPKGVS